MQEDECRYESLSDAELQPFEFKEDQPDKKDKIGGKQDT